MSLELQAIRLAAGGIQLISGIDRDQTEVNFESNKVCSENALNLKVKK